MRSFVLGRFAVKAWVGVGHVSSLFHVFLCNFLFELCLFTNELRHDVNTRLLTLHRVFQPRDALVTKSTREVEKFKSIYFENAQNVTNALTSGIVSTISGKNRCFTS